MSEGQMQPGWYYAQGDPPGMQRYWDGTQWTGAPQPVDQAQPFMGNDLAVATQTGIPDGLKILTIVLTVLKAIPWVIFLIVTLYVASIGGEIDNTFADAGIDDLGPLEETLILFVVLMLVFLAIGAAMLFFQLRTALKAQLLGLAVIAGIMALIDFIWAALTLTSDPVSLVSVFIIGATFIAQAIIFGWAISLYRERS